MSVLLLIIVYISLFLFWLWKDAQRPKAYPPGPRCWPLFGNVPQLTWRGRGGKLRHQVFKELSDEYGAVVGLRMFDEKTVIISGKEAVREALAKDEFSGRPDGFIFLYRSNGKKLGIGFNDGPSCAVQKRIALKNLRFFGLGKNTMEARITYEILHLIASIKRQGQSAPLAMSHLFTVPVINVLWSIVALKRFSTDDKEILKIIDANKNMFKSVASGSSIFLNQFPWIRHFIPESSGFSLLYDHLIKVEKFLTNIIDDHIRTLNPDAPKDLVDAYLLEINKSDRTELSRDHLSVICDDLFTAGTETTSNSLCFFVLYMIRYPDVQKKIQREIDIVIGRDRTPTLEDRLTMPYTEAVVLESLRIAPVLPLSLPHKAMTTTQFKNYTIEKGTNIIVSLQSVCMDSYWKDPLQFRPERFIGDDGKVIQDENLIVFGMGKRRCFGDHLGKSTMFLFIASLLQQFDLKAPKNEPLPSFECVDGFTVSPKPFNAVFALRAD